MNMFSILFIERCFTEGRLFLREIVWNVNVSLIIIRSLFTAERNIFKQTVALPPPPPMVQFSFLLGSGIPQETSICPHSWALTSHDLCSPLELRLSACDFYLHGCVPRSMGAPAKAAPDDFVTYKKFLICEMGVGVAAHLESVILSLSPWLTQLLPADCLMTVYSGVFHVNGLPIGVRIAEEEAGARHISWKNLCWESD